jgi:hypothetical protein
MKPESNSGGIVDVRGFVGEDLMPTADIRAFAEVLSEITMSGLEQRICPLLD